MPAFLESMFSFGERDHPQDCNMTSFQSRKRISSEDRGIEVPQLGRSGRLMEQCYGLRSVEPSESQPDWPWSVRLCSIYHTLDVGSAQATWVVIKGNTLIEKLVRDSMTNAKSIWEEETLSFQHALHEALTVHKLIAGWSGNNWQLYVNFLEDKVQELTRPTLSVTMEEQPATTTTLVDQITDLPPTSSPTQMSFDPDCVDEMPATLKKTRSSFRSFARRLHSPTVKSSSRFTASRRYTIPVSHHRFSFNDLPRLHYIEEKANEAFDVLSNNEEILEELKADYLDVFEELQMVSAETREDLTYSNFVNAVNRVQRNLRTQQSRVKQLLRLLGDRKALVCTWLT